MDKHGDWVILEGFQPRWFRAGEEEALPLPPWLPSSVSLLDGHPVVTVFPFPMGKRGRRETRLLLAEERARYSRPETAKIQVNSALPVIRALAEGRDGRLYLLVRPKAGGLALDRLDLVQGVVSRVDITAESPGAVSMVAGADGLFLVPYNGKDKRWFVSWEALNDSDWRPLEGVDGLAPEVAAAKSRR